MGNLKIVNLEYYINDKEYIRNGIEKGKGSESTSFLLFSHL